ncbi:hypothetical protein GCM10009819_25730 [Agromyces tropicus]|uniref:Anti-sigma K factor RskA C-terminal domain-containing protein n=1 Tax=Agromyces tropicus TaxID=555371 RepID=A0ABN2UMZ6_9MICO
MDHVEPDELAVLALDGRDPEPAVRDHLASCADCRDELASLSRTVRFGRGTPDDRVERPSPGVWSAIHAELGLDAALAADPLAERTALTEGTELAEGDRHRGIAAGAALEGDRHVAPVRASTPSPARPPATPRPPARAGARRRPSRWLVASIAALAGIVAGVGIGLAVAGAGVGPEPSPNVVLADAELDAFPGWEGAGRATVEEDAAGERTIVVDLDTPVPAGEVREVWLIRADASGLVSLGLMDGDSSRFAIPEGIDLAEYPLVDVSAEPVDGDPAHSGDSIVRGELSEA